MTCEGFDTGAVFSECGKYRYKLWRTWNTAKPVLYFILMNPSTADEIHNDPTIERQQRRAHGLGFGGIVVLNCGAIRETNSKKAWQDKDPIGPDNYRTIRQEIDNNPSAQYVAAWGRPAHQFGAAEEVLRLFRAAGVTLKCLGTNGDGSPKHPLYVRYEQELMDYRQ